VEEHTLTGPESGIAQHSHSAGTLSVPSSGAHTHPVYLANTNSGFPTTTAIYADAEAAGADLSVETGVDDDLDFAYTIESSGAHTHGSLNGSTANAGATTAASAHTNVQPVIILNKMIYAGV
jgi:hypothetical protein